MFQENTDFANAIKEFYFIVQESMSLVGMESRLREKNSNR
ncbi:MAG: hypothetical protein H6Q74_1886 [Firmicutes bacterium]|nr:hypothetical protein [Bacillota bacterium]